MNTSLTSIDEAARLGKSELPLLEVIAQRRSPRRFLDIPIEPEKQRSMFEAARCAPSSLNEQPWRFIVVTKDNASEYERLFSTLTDRNKVWASEAPVLVVSVAKLFVDRNGKPNRFALHDVSGAMANLTMQAVSLGLQVHQMGGFDAVRLRTLYQIPDGFEPVTVSAIGYADEFNLLTRERTRNELATFVFQGQWGTPAFEQKTE